MLFKFTKDTSGNVAITTTLCLLVLTGVAGGAFDYTRVANTKAHFQNTADAAALAAAIKYRKTDWNSAKQEGESFINVHNPQADDYQISEIELTLEDKTIVATIKGHSYNYILPAIGIEKYEFGVTSKVNLPDYPIEVSLVLDTTYSMTAGGKMTTLKSTARDFVDTLLNIDSDQVKISMVPFAQYVNVDPSSKGASWLEAEDEEIVTPRQCTTTTPIVSQSGCTTKTTNIPAQNVPEQCSPAQYNDGVLVSPASCTPAHTVPASTSTAQTCSNVQYGTPVETCTPEQTHTIYWNGCVASRPFPYNTNDQDYGKKIPGPNNLVCPSPITPLTDNVSQLNSAINALTPVGNTYIAQGMVWGYRTLTPEAPYSEALSDSNREDQGGKRYIILMTDGQNISSPDYSTGVLPSYSSMSVGLHTGSDIDESDDLLEKTCNSAKAEEIEIYTVSFGTGVDDDTKELLENCASNNGGYFDAETNNDLIAAFQKIADSIVTVYLSE